MIAVDKKGRGERKDGILEEDEESMDWIKDNGDIANLLVVMISNLEPHNNITYSHKLT